MFDLAFFKAVRIVIGWQETPRVRYLNEHQTWTRRNRDEITAMSPTKKQLLLYVETTYPSYFDFALHKNDVTDHYVYYN